MTRGNCPISASSERYVNASPVSTPRDRDADLGKDVARHAFVVAGQHLHGNARGGHGLDGGPSACLRWIKENGEAGKNKVTLVTDCGGPMTRIDHTAGDAQSAESLSTESIKRGLEATARLRVERQYLAIRVLVPPRQPQKVLRRTLDIKRRSAPCSTRTETRRRSKSNGTSSIFFQPAMSNGWAARIALSSGLFMPVSNRLFT